MITPSFALTATERVLPRLALDFTTAILDSRITFTRALNTATVTNSSGYIAGVNADLPRFDFDPVTLACRGLLIEEARTNLFTYSENFSDASWSKTGGSITADAIASPANTTTADALVEDASNGAHRVSKSIAFTSGTAYTASIYLKAGIRTEMQISFSSTYFGADKFAIFDLTNVTATPQTGVTASITAVSNGFYRLTATTTATATGTGAIFFNFVSSGSSSYVGSNGSIAGYYWGAQTEAGAFATSYIPTTTTALTRNADVATMTGTNFSSWYNATEGSFVLQAARYVGTSGSMTHFSVSDGTNLDWYRLYSSGSDGLEYFTGLDNGVTQWDRSRSAVTSDTPFQVCATYKENAIAFALNGSAVTTDSAATIPTVDRLVFGQFGNGTAAYGRQYIRKLMYYPQALTNAETTAFSKQG